MADSTTEIANLALNHLGVGEEIADLDTENGVAANAMRRFYVTALKETLRAFVWGFARRFVELSQVEEDPTTEWRFSYRYPSDADRLIRIVSGGGSPDPDTAMVRYQVGSDATGALIYCNEEDPTAEYVAYVSDPTKYPHDFVMALSWQLAMLAAPQLAKGGAMQLVQMCSQQYELSISRARANNANEQRPNPPPDSEFITSRN